VSLDLDDQPHKSRNILKATKAPFFILYLGFQQGIVHALSKLQRKTSTDCKLNDKIVTLSIFQTINDPLCNKNLFDFVSTFALDLVDQLFFTLYDLSMLSVPAQLKVDLGLETGNVYLPLVCLAKLSWLIVSHAWNL
jgi:hypothetical protein